MAVIAIVTDKLSEKKIRNQYNVYESYHKCNKELIFYNDENQTSTIIMKMEYLTIQYTGIYRYFKKNYTNLMVTCVLNLMISYFSKICPNIMSHDQSFCHC